MAKQYAQITDGTVSLIKCSEQMAQKLINAGLTIIDVTDMTPMPQSGWTYDGVNFYPNIPVVRTDIDTLYLWDRFTEAEQEILTGHNNNKVKRFLFDLRMRGTVNITKTLQALIALEGAGILAVGRANEILGGS